MDERTPKVGDRIVYRTSTGDDVDGTIAALSSDGGATLALDNGLRVSGIERNDAGEREAFLNSWRLVPMFVEPTAEQGPMYMEALAAGLIMMLLDASNNVFPLDQNGLKEALKSFRAGVGLVLEMRE